MRRKKALKMEQCQFLIFLLFFGVIFLSASNNWRLLTEPLARFRLGTENSSEKGFSGFVEDADGEDAMLPEGSDDFVDWQDQEGLGDDFGAPSGNQGTVPDGQGGTPLNDPGNGAGEGDQEQNETGGNPAWQIVTEDYFDDALFIGDSRVVGMRDYGKLEGHATFYAYEGMNIFKMLGAEIVEVPGQRKKISVEDALSQNQFGKIYMMVGINELDIGTVDRFERTYRETVDRIKELQPDAIIYVQSIMLVTQQRSQKGDYVTNEGIMQRNDALMRIADNQTIFYLDVNEAVVDESGCMAPEYTTDGVHLKAKYVPLWTEWLKCHAMQ